MRVGRFADGEGTRFWGLISSDEAAVRWIEEPFAMWAPKLAERDSSQDIRLGRTSRLADLRLVAPVEPGARIFGTGVNYPTHLAEGSLAEKGRPDTMPGYVKLDSTIVDPWGEIRYPSNTNQLDHEIEIVMVVGQPVGARRPRTACLLGYTIGNDVSPRDVGRPTGGVDLYTMKAQDQTAPVGPWITTLDEFGGPGQPSFDFSLRVNGEVRQRDNTKNMMWPLEEILEFFNERNRLRAGDLIFTGTTGGTGLLTGRYLEPGDRLDLEAHGIGVLTNTVGPKARAEVW